MSNQQYLGYQQNPAPRPQGYGGLPVQGQAYHQCVPQPQHQGAPQPHQPHHGHPGVFGAFHGQPAVGSLTPPPGFPNQAPAVSPNPAFNEPFPPTPTAHPSQAAPFSPVFPAASHNPAYPTPVGYPVATPPAKPSCAASPQPIYAAAPQSTPFAVPMSQELFLVQKNKIQRVRQEYAYRKGILGASIRVIHDRHGHGGQYIEKFSDQASFLNFYGCLYKVKFNVLEKVACYIGNLNRNVPNFTVHVGWDTDGFVTLFEKYGSFNDMMAFKVQAADELCLRNAIVKNVERKTPSHCGNGNKFPVDTSRGVLPSSPADSETALDGIC